ncbi:MAG: energy transducer TonB [Bacteroidota bacterium]
MKTNLLTATLILATTALFAQGSNNKVFYLDSLHNITTDKNYTYTRVVEDYDFKKDSYVVTEYYQSGKTSMTAISKDKNNLKLNGIRNDYYENGNKKRESNYTNNILYGLQLEWHENGEKKAEKEITWDVKNKSSIIKIKQFWNKDKQQTIIDGNGQYEDTDENLYEKGLIKDGKKDGPWEGKNLRLNFSFKELYKKGELKSGISIDKNNNKFPYKELMVKPEPKKGMNNFYQYIGKNYKTPEIQGLKGKVYASFVVDKDGSLTDFKILRDIGYGTGKEAIRVLSNIENWKPGKMRGMAVRVLYSLPITINTP